MIAAACGVGEPRGGMLPEPAGYGSHAMGRPGPRTDAIAPPVALAIAQSWLGVLLAESPQRTDAPSGDHTHQSSPAPVAGSDRVRVAPPTVHTRSASPPLPELT